MIVIYIKQHPSNICSWQFMKKLSNTETKFKESFACKKIVILKSPATYYIVFEEDVFKVIFTNIYITVKWVIGNIKNSIFRLIVYYLNWETLNCFTVNADIIFF